MTIQPSQTPARDDYKHWMILIDILSRVIQIEAGERDEKPHGIWS